MKRRILLLILMTLGGMAAAQPIYISSGGGITSGLIDTTKLGREADYYSNMFIKYFGKIEGEFGKYYTYLLSFENDPFWQNLINGGLGFKMGVFKVGLGVQIGMFDFDAGYDLLDLEFWDLGIVGDIRLEFPGIIFLEANFILNIGGNWTADKEGSTHRQLIGFSGGFWLPHILISGKYFQKDFDAVVEVDSNRQPMVSTRAGYTRISGRIEFFAKNIPFRLGGEGGFLTQSGNYSSAGLWQEPVTDEYYFAGAFISFDLGRHVCFSINGETPVSSSRMGSFNQFTASANLVFSIPGNK